MSEVERTEAEKIFALAGKLTKEQRARLLIYGEALADSRKLLEQEANEKQTA